MIIFIFIFFFFNCWNGLIIYILNIYINIILIFKRRLELYPNGIDNRDYISLYLKCTDRNDDPSYHICAKKALYIRNYNDYSYFYCNGKVVF